MPLRGTAQERAPLAPPGDGDGAAPNGGASAACSPCPWSSSSTSYFVVFACSVAILLGYDIGVMSGAALAIEQSLGLTVVQKQVVVGSLNFVSGFGALLVGRLCDSIGRRACITASMLLYALGSAIMLGSQGFHVLLAGP